MSFGWQSESITHTICREKGLTSIHCFSNPRHSVHPMMLETMGNLKKKRICTHLWVNFKTKQNQTNPPATLLGGIPAVDLCSMCYFTTDQIDQRGCELHMDWGLFAKSKRINHAWRIVCTSWVILLGGLPYCWWRKVANHIVYTWSHYLEGFSTSFRWKSLNFWTVHSLCLDKLHQP